MNYYYFVIQRLNSTSEIPSLIQGTVISPASPFHVDVGPLLCGTPEPAKQNQHM